MNEVIKLLREVQPVVWEAAVRQQYINGIFEVILGSAVLVVFAVCFRIFIKSDIKDDNTGSFLGTVFFGLFGFPMFAFGIAHLINPNYFAYKSLLP